MKVFLRVATAVQVASLFVVPHLQAQLSLPVGPGSRVRVTIASEGSRSGEVIALTADSVVIVRSATRDTIGFRRTEISRLEISAGERRNTLKGLGLGVLIGAGTGAILGFASGDDKCGENTCLFGDAEFKAGALGIVLGVAGGVIGTITGALKKSDRRVIAPELHAIAPIIDARGRFGLAIRY